MRLPIRLEGYARIRYGSLTVLANVTVAAITATIRGIPTEVPVGPAQGLARQSVVNCDNLFTIPKRELASRRGALGPESVGALRDALRAALDVD